jgi:hypothetical protein
MSTRAGRDGDERSFRRFAGLAAVISAPFAAANLIAMFAAVHFDLDAISHPLVLLHQGGSAATLWRWSMVFDAFGYYLLIVPAIMVLRSSLRHSSPNWTDFSALCLLAYTLIGAIGCAILATTVPPLLTGYAAAGAQHHVFEIVFTGYSNAVYRGLWNLLEEFVAGVGWLGIGLVILTRRRRFGLLTIVLGAACLIDSLGTAVNVDAIATVGLGIYLILAPIWACCVGLFLLKHSGGDAVDAVDSVKVAFGVAI